MNKVAGGSGEFAGGRGRYRNWGQSQALAQSPAAAAQYCMSANLGALGGDWEWKCVWGLLHSIPIIPMLLPIPHNTTHHTCTCAICAMGPMAQDADGRDTRHGREVGVFCTGCVLIGDASSPGVLQPVARWRPVTVTDPCHRIPG